MSYTYQVLNEYQIRMLDKYVPSFDVIKFSELMDSTLVTTGGTMHFLDIPAPSAGDPVTWGDATIGRDTFIGRDLEVTRNVSILQSLQVGGGYGSTGWTCDAAGNTAQDGVADFTVSGCRISTATPATSTSVGSAGAIAYDANYFYCCIANNTWRRVAWGAPW